MILAVTGHRPNKLGGYRTPNTTFNLVMEGLDRALMALKPDYVISGMSLGVDQWMAELCIFNGIPFIAALPFETQDSIWPAPSRVKYRSLLDRAYRVEIISPGEYAGQKMQIRNEWMIENASDVLAVWDGTPGGTFNCINAALTRGKQPHFLQWQNGLALTRTMPELTPPRVLTESEEIAHERRIRERQRIRAQGFSNLFRQEEAAVRTTPEMTEGRRAAIRAAEEYLRQASENPEEGETRVLPAPAPPVVQEEKVEELEAPVGFGRLLDL